MTMNSLTAVVRRWVRILFYKGTVDHCGNCVGCMRWNCGLVWMESDDTTRDVRGTHRAALVRRGAGGTLSFLLLSPFLVCILEYFFLISLNGVTDTGKHGKICSGCRRSPPSYLPNKEQW